MAIILLITFLCSFIMFGISAISGGGAGLMLIPLLSTYLPINQVPGALSIGTFTSSASRLIIFKKNICWHIVKYFVPAAIPAVWFGAWLLKFLNPIYLEIGLGIFLVSNLPFIFKKSKQLEESHHPKNIILSLIGFSAGFLSGLTGAVGLIFNRFYLRYGLSKEAIVATRAANEIILHLIKIILYSLFGLISMKVIWIGVIVAVAAIFSTWAIKWVLPKLSENLFKKIGYSAMVLSGVAMLIFSAKDISTMYHARVYGITKNEGMELQLNWQNRGYALEYSYDNGFQFKLEIPLENLTDDQKIFVLTEEPDADDIVIANVYTIGKDSYSVYYFKEKKLFRKIDFD